MRLCLVVCASLFLCASVSLSDELEQPERKKLLFHKPDVPPSAYLALFFEEPSITASNLIISAAKKDGADVSIEKYDGRWEVEVEESSAFVDDYSLVLKSKAKHHAVSWPLTDTISFDTEELVIQYEVKFAKGIECGGAYLKLLSSSPNLQLETFNDKTPYTIMFGPDKCGSDHKFHFIMRYKNPRTGVFEEKHAKRVTGDIEKYFSDKKTHLYTLVMRSDNTFERYIDQVKVQSGNLLNDMEPPINPPKEIDDPNDKKPGEWDEREKIPDDNAKKPDEWDEDAPELITDETAAKPDGWLDDEPQSIPDPSAEKPKDWDSAMDGDWEPPMITNPKCASAPGCGDWHRPMIKNPEYKGKWSPPLIPNPAYKGVWKAARIPNPDYYYDEEPFRGLTPVSAVGLELWSMTEDIVFDNFLIVSSLREANAFAKQTWEIKSEAERLADTKARSVVDAVRETYKEKPIFVILIAAVCTLPILLCLWYLCRSPSRTTVAMHKKTDARTPDDQPTKYDSTRPEANDEPRDEIDVDEEDQSEDDLIQVPSAGDEQQGNKSLDNKADLESDSNNESGLGEGEYPQPEKQAIRKRRARKE